jgi:hypothetical protein
VAGFDSTPDTNFDWDALRDQGPAILGAIRRQISSHRFIPMPDRMFG